MIYVIVWEILYISGYLADILDFRYEVESAIIAGYLDVS